ncbi:MAG: hypothetical protein ACPGWR_00430 [Ardenticatenaceae bacterium]
MKKLTIGICTISTRHENYLPQTLSSLLTHTNQQEQQELQIVVFDCDMTAQESSYISATKAQFRSQIEAGLLEIVRTSPADYPDLTDLPLSFGDSPDRVYWRTKQCLDYSLIFQHCAGKAEYYLHLEDDVLCAPQYYQKLCHEIERFPASDWAAMQFCDLGFIGMLFKDADLKKIASFFRTFSDEMPVDWLIKYFLALRRRKGQEFIRAERGLFQHIGYYSSLKDKLSDVESPIFDRSSLHDLLRQHHWTKGISTAFSRGFITYRKAKSYAKEMLKP